MTLQTLRKKQILDEEIDLQVMKEPRDVLLNKRKNGLKRAKSSATLKRDISYLNEIVTKKSPSKEFSLDSNIVQGLSLIHI